MPLTSLQPYVSRLQLYVLQAATLCTQDLGCRQWTAGAFCQQCNVTDGSRYFSVATSTCKECTGSTANPIISLVALFLFVGGLAYAYSKFKPHERFAWFRVLRMRSVTMMSSISLRAKLKQCVGFYQVATNIREVYNIEMPSDTQSLLDSLKVRVRVSPGL